MKQKLLALVLTTCMVLTLLPVSALAEDGGVNMLAEPGTGAGILSVVGGEGTDYDYENNTLTVKTGKALTISGTTTTDRIVVEGGTTANITLTGVDIQFSDRGQWGAPGTCAFEIAGDATCNLTLIGENTLKSGSKKAGLQVQGNATLTITDSSTGSLTATGGEYGAGIGGGDRSAGGSITINGGMVTATSGICGAGIGGGVGGAGGNITINDGVVTATAKSTREGGAAIGGGYGDGGLTGTILINGGTITAVGEVLGAGIGCGGNSNKAGCYEGNEIYGTVTINAGFITATGGAQSAGIGGGSGSCGARIFIHGGTVSAQGGDGTNSAGAGIGGGQWAVGSPVIVSGGTVTAIGGVATDSGSTGAGIGSGVGAGVQGMFTTAFHGQPGNAFVVASSIPNHNDSGVWSGVIFEGDSGAVYGSPALGTDAVIPEGKTLTVGSGKTLTVGSDVTLTNHGTVTNSGIIANDGAIVSSGTINNHGTITGTPPSGTVNEQPSVTVTFEKADGSPLEQANTATYGDVIKIVATVQKAAANGPASRAAVDTVDFYLGNSTTGVKLNESPVAVAPGSPGKLEVTLSGEKWKPNYGAYTITAAFGGSTGLLSGTGTAELTVNKMSQTPPSPPSGTNEIKPTSITLSPVDETGNGQIQYVYVLGDDDPQNSYGWKSSPDFTDLLPNTEYTFYTRFAGDLYYKPAISTTGLSVCTAAAQPALPADGLSIADGSIKIVEGQENTILVMQGQSAYQITNDTELKITGGAAATENTIRVEGATANIVLEDVSLECVGGGQIAIKKGADVELTLKGENAITAKTGCWGAIFVEDDSNLSIDGDGSLTIEGQDAYSAPLFEYGIGGEEIGNITIRGGTFSITAQVGIGCEGRRDISNRSITITDGRFTINSNAVCIGSKDTYTSPPEILISGGVIIANGPTRENYGEVAGIGTATKNTKDTGHENRPFTINGGTIIVNTGMISVPINGAVTIDGGSISATAIEPAPKNAVGEAIYPATITAAANGKVQGIYLESGGVSAGYGTPTAVPGNGKLTVYLPAGEYTGYLLADGKLLEVSAAVTNGGTNDAAITDTNVEITPPAGKEPSLDENGKVVLPGGSTVTTPDGSSTVPENGGTLDPADGTVTANPYTVTFDSQGGSAVESTTVTDGGPVVKPADPTRSGYSFGGWYKESTCTTAWNFAVDTVAGNVTLYAKWTQNSSGGGSASNRPSASVDGTGGKVTTGSGTVTITPDEGYQIGKITVNGKEVDIPADGKLTGLKRTDKVVVTFEKIPDKPTVDMSKYTDLDAGAWYYEATAFVVEHGLFQGTSDTTFSPNADMTRAMLMTVLARADGQDTTAPSGGKWYDAGMKWAVEQGISDGSNPEGNISREQLATMLYRYAGSPTPPNLVLDFNDVGNLAGYATDAVRWAVSEGIVTGKGGGILDPKGNATRAEVAAILMRYLSK